MFYILLEAMVCTQSQLKLKGVALFLFLSLVWFPLSALISDICSCSTEDVYIKRPAMSLFCCCIIVLSC